MKKQNILLVVFILIASLLLQSCSLRERTIIKTEIKRTYAGETFKFKFKNLLIEEGEDDWVVKIKSKNNQDMSFLSKEEIIITENAYHNFVTVGLMHGSSNIIKETAKVYLDKDDKESLILKFYYDEIPKKGELSSEFTFHFYLRGIKIEVEG